MTIAVAADHAGFALKQFVLDTAREMGHEALDLGTHSADRSIIRITQSELRTRLLKSAPTVRSCFAAAVQAFA